MALRSEVGHDVLLSAGESDRCRQRSGLPSRRGLSSERHSRELHTAGRPEVTDVGAEVPGALEELDCGDGSIARRGERHPEFDGRRVICRREHRWSVGREKRGVGRRRCAGGVSRLERPGLRRQLAAAASCYPRERCRDEGVVREGRRRREGDRLGIGRQCCRSANRRRAVRGREGIACSGGSRQHDGHHGAPVDSNGPGCRGLTDYGDRSRRGGEVHIDEEVRRRCVRRVYARVRI